MAKKPIAFDKGKPFGTFHPQQENGAVYTQSGALFRSDHSFICFEGEEPIKLERKTPDDPEVTIEVSPVDQVSAQLSDAEAPATEAPPRGTLTIGKR